MAQILAQYGLSYRPVCVCISYGDDLAHPAGKMPKSHVCPALWCSETLANGPRGLVLPRSRSLSWVMNMVRSCKSRNRVTIENSIVP